MHNANDYMLTTITEVRVSFMSSFGHFDYYNFFLNIDYSNITLPFILLKLNKQNLNQKKYLIKYFLYVCG